MSVEEAVINTPPVAHKAPSSVPRGLESPWLWLGVIFVLFLLSPYVPLPNRMAALALAIVTTGIYVYAVVQVIALGTRTQFKPLYLVVGLVVCAGLWWALDRWGLAAVFEPIRAARKARHAPPQSAVLLLQMAQLVSDASLMGAAIFGGNLVARLITAPNMLGPICGVVALIDIWGVLFAGPVSQIIEKAPQIAAKAMPSLPAAGALSKNAHFAIEPLRIGVGDYLFLGLLFAALHLNGMNWRGAAKLAVPFIFVTLMVVQFSTLPMPGLLPIGLAIALPNLKYFQFTREENFAMLWAGLFVIVLSIGVYIGLQRALPEKKKVPARPSPNTIQRKPSNENRPRPNPLGRDHLEGRL